MISHQYKCIFIHIPKTAGTSIEQKLGHFGELRRGVQDHRTISDIEPVSISDIAQACIHRNSSLAIRRLKKAIKDRTTNFSACYKAYYKFSFVRNPWARVFSWYKNVMRDQVHQQRYNVDANCTFNDFLKNHMDQRQLNSQLFWIVDKSGNIPFDFIGKFEKLEEDFEYIAGQIGLKDNKLPKLIAGDGQHYTQFYDFETKDIVYKLYKDEIKHFNYEYGH